MLWIELKFVVYKAGTLPAELSPAVLLNFSLSMPKQRASLNIPVIPVGAQLVSIRNGIPDRDGAMWNTSDALSIL